MSNRVGIGGRNLTRTDKRMIDVCRTCTLPPDSCEKRGLKCEYKRMFGDASPKVLRESCGKSEEVDTFDANQMNKNGGKVLREMGIKSFFRSAKFWKLAK